jgi:hypothetical protein
MTIQQKANCCGLRFWGSPDEIKIDEDCIKCGSKWQGTTHIITQRREKKEDKRPRKKKRSKR